MTRWHNLGVATLAGSPVAASDEQAALFLPAGHRGPAFVTLANFRTFLRYNNSTVYALAVGELGDRLAGAPPIQTPWPTDERPLTLSERIELQTLLDKLGFDVGEPDGIIGSGTRQGVRRYQKKIGLPPDGFATVALLDRLRADAAGAPSDGG
jgi:membrane-bound lytic murein transglycosylase B